MQILVADEISRTSFERSALRSCPKFESIDLTRPPVLVDRVNCVMIRDRGPEPKIQSLHSHSRACVHCSRPSARNQAESKMSVRMYILAAVAPAGIGLGGTFGASAVPINGKLIGATGGATELHKVGYYRHARRPHFLLDRNARSGVT
jgi:hypothetical protein